MNLDSYINIEITLKDEATVREIFAATRDEMLVHFDGFPTKEEAKEWLIYDADEEEITKSIFFSITCDILETNALNIVIDNFDDFYDYVKTSYEY